MTRLRNRLRTKYILADYQKWKGLWVHYSRFPSMKVNPVPQMQEGSSFHQDPAGIYLFPEKFRTEGSLWHNMPYKFVVQVPDDLKVLDMSHVNNPQAALNLLTEMNVTDGAEFPQFKEYIETKGNPADSAWEYLQRYFQRKHGAFNKALRKAGYEAVFDDTGSIHTSEVQLIILDPRRLKVVRREDRTGTGYELVEEVAKIIADEGKKYGKVHQDRLKRKFENWDRVYHTAATTKIESDSGRYIYITVDGMSHSDDKRKHAAISKLDITASYAKPDKEKMPRDLRYYSKDIRDVNIEEIKDMIKRLLHYQFVEAKEDDGSAAT